MKKVQRKSRSARYENAAAWPSWTDESRYAPTEVDERWAADALNDGAGHTNDLPPDDVLDLMADEAQAGELLERGLRLF